jgi:hypothetical protein
MMGGFQSIRSKRLDASEAPSARARGVRAWLRAAPLLVLVAAGRADSASPAAAPLPEARPLRVLEVARIDRPIGRADAQAAARIADAPTSPPDARVSTSPDPSTPAQSAIHPPTPGATASEDDGLPPLTRAATRRRIESISPVPWLARFGPVSLEQRE